jgi:TatD DNase family protein
VLFDSHNHLQSSGFGEPVETMVAKMRAVGIGGCVVNATQESDWERVDMLVFRFPDFIHPSYGVHPWFADTVTDGWDGRLRQRLLAQPQASIGEVGVDGWVEKPSMEIQREVFMRQVGLAAELNRVMTVHCLKAWDEFFRLMDTAEAWPEKFLIHSFGGSLEVAQRLVKRGAWFSFSGYFLHERKRRALEVFKQLPKDRILLETDAPDMLPPEEVIAFPLSQKINHPANLGSIANAFERELGKGILGQISENGRVFWEL